MTNPDQRSEELVTATTTAPPEVPLPPLAPTLTRWQRLRVWWHVVHLRFAARVCRDAGLVALGVDQYRAAVGEIARLSNFIEESGALLHHLAAYGKIRDGARRMLEALSDGEKLASPKHFEETLARFIATKRRDMSVRQQRKLMRAVSQMRKLEIMRRQIKVRP